MAAQDAELKLKVSLDLAFFRTQLAGLGQAAAGYKIPVQVQFDRQSVQSELNKLGENIRRRTYRLNIETNLSAEIEKADKLAQRLKALSGKLNIGGGGGFARSQQGAAGLIEYMQSQGLSGGGGFVGAGRSTRLKAALEDLTVKQLQGLAKSEGITGVSKLNKSPLINKLLTDLSQGAMENILGNVQMALRPLRGQSKTSAARSMPNLNEILDRMANVTSNPRAAQRMLRMMPESRISTNLIGAANRQAAFQEQYPEGFKLPGFNAPKAFDPLLKAIAKDFADYARTVNVSDPWVGQIGNGIANIVAKAANAPKAQKLLPAIGGTTSPVNALEARLAASRSGLGAGSVSGLVQQNVRGVAPSGMLTSATGQPRFKTPTAQPSTVSGIFQTGGVAVQGNIPGLPYRMNQFQFPSSGMMGPSSPLGQITANTSMFGGGGPGGGGAGGGGGGRGLFGGMGDFGRALGGVNLPGAGTIRELGQEFGFAAKQVLLFGTAYKALAFITDFPAQVGNAVGQLQTFRNTLGAISPTAQEAAASNQLILDLVNNYNIPLQSARDGFTKLYASMAPAGFAGDEIRNLFTGISQAAATFGMSADKVDRVNYAFAQMASKGQVMSEELKGQLGDVLPGAMAIFAQAAGFKGSKAIQDFSAALEEGRYKGKAMVELLNNVSVVMTQKFGPGAEGAATTFQGSINRMQNSLKLLYESFEPVAVGFLNSVVVPMTQGIKQIADGMNSFMSGSRAKTAGGFALAQELEKLRPAFDGIKANASGVIQQLGSLAKTALELSKVFLQIAGNPIVGYLAKLYIIILPLNMALNVMRGLWVSNIAQLLIFNTRIATGASTLSAFRGMMAATGATAQTTAASIRATGLTMRTFFASTGVGLVLAGISALIERFMSLNQKLEETKLKAIGAAQAIRSMSSTEARAEQFKRERIVRELGVLGQQPGVRRGREAVVEVSPEMAKRFEDAGIPVQTTGLTGKRFIPKTSIPALQQQQEQLAGEARYAQRRSAFEERQMVAPPALAPISAGEGDGTSGRKLQPYDRSRLDIIQQTFEKQKQILDTRLLEEKISRTGYGVALANLTLTKEKAEIEEGYRLKVLETNRDNMSASDKQLKLADLQLARTQELENAEGRKNLAVKKATEEIRTPFKDAIRDANLELEKSTAEIDNLKKGYTGLTPEQEASFRIEEMTKNLRADEYKSIQDTIGALKEKIQAQIENNRLLEQERNLAAIRSRISTAGGGLMAGFYGNAAQTYERSLIESRGNVDYAKQMAELETQAMKLETVFGGIQNAIGGIGDAFASMMTQGVVAMIEGTATAQEVFSSFLKAVGEALLQAAAQMIATYIAIGIARIFAGMGGGGGYGDGKVATNAFNSGGIPGLSNTTSVSGGQFGSFAPGANPSFGIGTFADGGMVSGPTLGLIGEGGEPEYVIPQSKMRGAMDRYAAGTRGASVIPSGPDSATGGDAMAAMMSPIDVRYQVERINSVDYVTNDQFQMGMRQAALQGAVQGEQRTLRRLQMSSSTRKRVGI